MRHEKPELSRANPYHLPKHRYYELKHFCLQYDDWKRELRLLKGWQSSGHDAGEAVKQSTESDPTEECALMRVYYSSKLDMISNCLTQLDPAIAPYILRGVTERLSYDKLSACGCPCGREMYYNTYRKFFWLLSKERG